MAPSWVLGGCPLDPADAIREAAFQCAVDSLQCATTRRNENPALGTACPGPDAWTAFEQVKVKYPSSKSDSRKSLIIKGLLTEFQQGETRSGLFGQVTGDSPSRVLDGLPAVRNSSALPRAATTYGNACRVTEHLASTRF